MSRFDVDRFEVPPDAELVCCICQGVLDQPKETPCRHVFCQVCIETWLEKHRTCPTCRGITRKDQLQNVLPLLQNMINRLRLRCVNHANGCQEVWMTEHHTDVHDDVCPYKKIKCKHRLCKRELIRKNLAKHESTCDLAEGMCPKFCGLTVFVKKMRSHSCLEELKAKVKEQEDIIKDQKTQIQQLQDEVKNMNEQLQNQEDWGDDDYYSEDDNGWESWSGGSNISQSNASNDNDSMVGFSENSDFRPYDPWSPQTYNVAAAGARMDVVYRVTPPASPTESDQRGTLPAPTLTTSSPARAAGVASPAAAISDHNYYSYDDHTPMRPDSDDYEGSGYSNSQYSNYGTSRDHYDDQSNSQGDGNSQPGSFSWSSGPSGTPIASEDQASFGSFISRSYSRSSSVHSEDDQNSYVSRQSSSNSDSESSGNRVPHHGKFSHVNTSTGSSSDSDSEPGRNTGGKQSTFGKKALTLCVSDDQVTSSGLVEYSVEDNATKSSLEKRSKKRRRGSSESDGGAKQVSSKKVKRSTNYDQTDGTSPSTHTSGSSRSGEGSSLNHNNSTSDNHATLRIRRSQRRPKPVENPSSLPLYSSDSSDSDISYRAPTEAPSDVTISDEHMTDEFSESERNRFETVDRLLDKFCEESDSNDGSWTPSPTYRPNFH
ncbi:uncharacterized protein LOC135485213 [Lineus longissimus]|uniref:uncharacterized protein LOC135485213 n=1 Tax=Lineus longissimus TaxID=88925 RepID=UPI00315D3C0F